MWTPEYFVRYVPFPAKIEGITVPNDDGTFDIYINARFCRQKQINILNHELCHIQQDHFYDDISPISLIEESTNLIKYIYKNTEEKTK